MNLRQHKPSGLWVSDTGLVCMPPVKGRGGTRSRTFYWTRGWLKPDGYRMVTWQKKRYHVHRMVLETFGPPPGEGRHIVDHINRKRDDNRIDNLRWANHRENMLNSPKCDNALFSPAGIHTGTPEGKRKYSRRYYETHPDMFRENGKRYVEENRAAVNARARENYANDPERREKQRLATERWKKNNPERHRKYMHDYYEAHKGARKRAETAV